MGAYRKTVPSVTERIPHRHAEESRRPRTPDGTIQGRRLLQLAPLLGRDIGMSCPGLEAYRLHGLPAKEQGLPSLAFRPAPQLLWTRVHPRGGELCLCLYSQGRGSEGACAGEAERERGPMCADGVHGPGVGEGSKGAAGVRVCGR